ncbi:hypothetical protein LY76DRAFT_148384 [Colletotrichum caudatum]|nr:hypothetical protein LY76DRAFT_148384 [Colletotrichum caudatum]
MMDCQPARGLLTDCRRRITSRRRRQTFLQKTARQEDLWCMCIYIHICFILHYMPFSHTTAPGALSPTPAPAPSPSCRGARRSLCPATSLPEDPRRRRFLLGPGGTKDAITHTDTDTK